MYTEWLCSDDLKQNFRDLLRTGFTTVSKGLLFYLTCMSLPTPTFSCMWAVGQLGYMNIINEPTGSSNMQLSDEITTLYLLHCFILLKS
jgi:hypothetical protein